MIFKQTKIIMRILAPGADAQVRSMSTEASKQKQTESQKVASQVYGDT